MMTTTQRQLSISLFIILAFPLIAIAKQASDFSFLVIGDTRSEPYLPLNMSKAGMENILRHRFHNKKIELELKNNKPIKATIQQHGRPLVLYYNGGSWPQRIEEKHNNKYRQIYTRKGFDWVMKTTVKTLTPPHPDKPRFLIHGGDLILNGYLGRTLSSPYWSLLQNKLLKHLPQRVYAAVGNHESWEDPKLVGMSSALPWLKKYGFRTDHRIYSFSEANSRFIFLNSGPQCDTEKGTITDWCSIYPDYTEQMKFLHRELEDAKKNKLANIFLTYHKPSFIKVGHDPLPEDKNPHKILKPYAKDFNIVVFNSHAHTTEHYRVDGINYLVIGGGGAPQVFAPTGNPTTQTERYWNGKPRKEEYNILKITVSGTNIKATLQRLRPGHKSGMVTLFTMHK